MRLSLIIGVLLLVAPFGLGNAAAQGVIDEIQVLGEYIPDEKRATSEIANVIDADAISLAGDSDVAVALTRLPGLAADSSGKYLVIRGLSERYTTTSLNGAELPAPDPLKNAVPLDIFPTSLIGSVLVQKTYSAEYAGAFGGGLVEMRTKATPDGAFFNMEISTGGETESTAQKGLGYEGGGLDFLGLDDGDRGKDFTVADIETGTPARLETAGETINRNWTVQSENLSPDFGVSVEFGNAYDRLGYVAAVDYGRKTRHSVGDKIDYEANSARGRDIYTRDACVAVSVDPNLCQLQSTKTTIDLNMFASVDYSLSELSKLNNTVLLLRSTDSIAQRLGGDTDSRDLAVTSSTQWEERQLLANVLSGQHALDLTDDGDTDIEWHAAFAQATRLVPQRKTYAYSINNNNPLQLDMKSLKLAWSTLEDNVIDIGGAFLHPTYILGSAVDVKAGTGFVSKTRVSEREKYNFVIKDARGIDGTQSVEDILTPATIAPNAFVLDNTTDASDRFTASFTNLQGFIQADAQLTDWVRLSVGVRGENSEQEVVASTRAPVAPITVVQRAGALLPSATLTWEFAENMQFRLGYSRTVNRPTSRELAPARFIREDGRTEEGNPNLEIAQLTNFDLRYEWYFDTGSLTLGVFQKQIENPIEYTLNTLAGVAKLDTVHNGEEAELNGVEVELDTVLASFGVRELFLKANSAVIDSHVTRDPQKFRGAVRLNGPLQGQSDFLFNIQFGYRGFDASDSLNLVLTHVSERIYRLSAVGLPDLMETPPTELNLVYKTAFDYADAPIGVSLRLKNILQESTKREIGGRPAEDFSRGMELSLALKMQL